ncbi:MAG TPA: response regulator [Actinomycetota bacterium]
MTRRILVVDDEPDIVLLVQANVTAWGHECLGATSAAEARRICEDAIPDGMLLDVAMPHQDGPALLRELRADGLDPRRVTLLSAKPTDELVTLAEELRVRFLSKPFTLAALAAAVEALLADEEVPSGTNR